jgi:hypothetical protein
MQRSVDELIKLVSEQSLKARASGGKMRDLETQLTEATREYSAENRKLFELEGELLEAIKEQANGTK